MAKNASRQLSVDEERQVRAAQHRLDSLRRVAEDAQAEGRLAEVIRDTPGVREQVQSSLDA